MGWFEHLESLDGTQLEQGRLFFTHEQFLQQPLLLHKQQFGMLSKNKLDFHSSTFTLRLSLHVYRLVHGRTKNLTRKLHDLGNSTLQVAQVSFFLPNCYQISLLYVQYCKAVLVPECF